MAFMLCLAAWQLSGSYTLPMDGCQVCCHFLTPVQEADGDHWYDVLHHQGKLVWADRTL